MKKLIGVIRKRLQLADQKFTQVINIRGIDFTSSNLRYQNPGVADGFSVINDNGFLKLKFNKTGKIIDKTAEKSLAAMFREERENLFANPANRDTQIYADKITPQDKSGRKTREENSRWHNYFLDLNHLDDLLSLQWTAGLNPVEQTMAAIAQDPNSGYTFANL